MGGETAKRVNTCRNCALVLLAYFGMFFAGVYIDVTTARASSAANFAVVAGDGSGSAKPTPTGSPADSTSLHAPNDVVADSSGNPVISDAADDEIEVLATSSTNPGYVLASESIWEPGNLYVIAGAGMSPAAPTSSGSSALSTVLNSPQGLAIDSEGNVIFADAGSNVIAVIAVSQTNPGYDVASWSRGNVYAIAGNGNTYPAPTYEGSSENTVGLNSPAGVAVDADGNVVISDTFASEIAVLAMSPNNPGYQIDTTSRWTEGNLYEIAGGGSASPTYGGIQAETAALDGPEGLSVGANGNVVFADEEDNEVDLLSVSLNNSGFSSITSWTPGDVYVLAGGGSNSPTVGGVAAELSTLNAPSSVSIDGGGNVLIANSYANQIDLLTESSTNPGYSLGSSSLWLQNSLYVLIGGGSLSPTAAGANALDVALSDAQGVSVGGNGSIFVSDTGHGEIERLAIAPTAPSLTLSSVMTNSVALAWSSPAQDGGMPVSGFQVAVSDDSSTPATIVNESAGGNNAVIGGLTSGATYEFEVEAINTVGVSAPSNEVVVTTASVPGTTGTTLPTSSGTPNPDISPVTAASHPRSELKVFKTQAVSSAGYLTLVVRCLRRLCAGTVILKGVTRESRGSEQTFIAGSSHFTVRGKRTEKILVLLTRYSRRVAQSGRLIELRGLISVKNGSPQIFSVRTDESPSRAAVLRA